MHPTCRNARRPDDLLARIAEYVCDAAPHRDEAYATARLCLDGQSRLRAAGPELSRSVPSSWGRSSPARCCPAAPAFRAPPYELDPVQAAFCLGAMVRWLDYNDTLLAAEWGHPSDNLGAILATADWLSRQARRRPAAAARARRVDRHDPGL